MSRLKKRFWVKGLRRLPQTTGEQLSTLFHHIPQKVRFVLVTLIFSLVTTLLVSHYPLTVLPEYQVGEIARSDLIVPADLMAMDEAHPYEAAMIFKRNPVLLRAGEVVTAEKLPLLDVVRHYQNEQRNPKHLFGLLALI